MTKKREFVSLVTYNTSQLNCLNCLIFQSETLRVAVQVVDGSTFCVAFKAVARFLLCGVGCHLACCLPGGGALPAMKWRLFFYVVARCLSGGGALLFRWCWRASVVPYWWRSVQIWDSNVSKIHNNAYKGNFKSLIGV